jgi:ERI1 exoribonuclease 3
MVKYLAILDFEATCWSDNNNHEIIEFPTVIVDTTTRKIVDQFQTFVLPTRDPILSDFCKNLTTITQEQVNEGVSLERALEMHGQFMERYNDSMFATCGDWDLKTMLPLDLRQKGLTASNMYNKWINIKAIFTDKYGLKKRCGMMEMLDHAKIDHYGVHHRGIDDCINIANIAIRLLEMGWTV